MWIAPEIRGSGMGTRLLQHGLGFGRERGATTAELAVTVDNGAAERLYESAGFVPYGDLQPLREGSEFLITWMRKEL